MLIIFLPVKVFGDPFQQSSLENEEVACLAQYLEHTHGHKSVAREISLQCLIANSSSDVDLDAPSRKSPVYRLPIVASDRVRLGISIDGIPCLRWTQRYVTRK